MLNIFTLYSLMIYSQYLNENNVLIKIKYLLFY